MVYVGRCSCQRRNEWIAECSRRAPRDRVFAGHGRRALAWRSRGAASRLSRTSKTRGHHLPDILTAGPLTLPTGPTHSTHRGQAVWPSAWPLVSAFSTGTPLSTPALCLNYTAGALPAHKRNAVFARRTGRRSAASPLSAQASLHCKPSSLWSFKPDASFSEAPEEARTPCVLSCSRP